MLFNKPQPYRKEKWTFARNVSNISIWQLCWYVYELYAHLSLYPHTKVFSKICVEFLPRTARKLVGFYSDFALCKMCSKGVTGYVEEYVSQDHEWRGDSKMQEDCATFLEMIIIPSTTVRKNPELLMVLHGTSVINSSVICQTFPSGFSPGTSEEFRFFLTSLLLLEIVLNNFGHFRTLAIF